MFTNEDIKKLLLKGINRVRCCLIRININVTIGKWDLSQSKELLFIIQLKELFNYFYA